MSQTDLAKRLGIRKAATGTLLDGLEADGLVGRTRSRADRRLQLVSITEGGRRVVGEIDRMAEGLGVAYRKGISRSERLLLVAILRRLRENLRALEAAPDDEA